MSETVKDRAHRFYSDYADSPCMRSTAELLVEFGEAERKRAVEECIYTARVSCSRLFNGPSQTELAIAAALRALIAPPVPVWCKHCKLSDDAKTVTIYTGGGDVITQCYAVHVGQCPIVGCGAPKPEVTK